MNIERLVQMANDIAANFEGISGRAEAARGAANHLKKFWDPRMRGQILAHLNAGAAGLSPLAQEALRELQARKD